MAYPVDFGHSIFRMPGSNRCLVSQVSMIVACSTGTAQSSVLPLEMLISRTTWIVHGPEIALDICIRATSSLSCSMFAFLGYAADLLRNAQLWSDLGFVTSEKPSGYVDSDEMVTLQFSLTLREDLTPVLTRDLPGSIRKHMPVDAQPPSGIKIITISRIRIVLNFHSLSLQADVCLPIFSMAVRFVEDQHPLRGTNGSNALAYSLPRLPGDTPPSSQTLRAPVPEMYHSSSEKPTQFIWHCPGGLSGDYNTNTGEAIDELQGLLDFAIRNIISSNPASMACKVEQSSSGLVPKLADIAPAVFSPGYRDAVRQRAGLIPIIAKAIASVVKESDSEELQRKFAALRAFYMSNYENFVHDRAQGAPSDARSIIKCLLWTVTQNGVYSTSTACVLNPIYAAPSIGRASPLLHAQSPCQWPDDFSEELDIKNDYSDIYSEEEECIYPSSREDFVLDSESDPIFTNHMARDIDNYEDWNHYHQQRQEQDDQVVVDIEQVHGDSDEMISLGSSRNVHVNRFPSDYDINNEASREELLLLSPISTFSQLESLAGNLESPPTTPYECHQPSSPIEGDLESNTLISLDSPEPILFEETNVDIWGLSNRSAENTIFEDGGYDENDDAEMLHELRF